MTCGPVGGHCMDDKWGRPPIIFFHGGINCQFMETQGTKKDME